MLPYRGIDRDHIPASIPRQRSAAPPDPTSENKIQSRSACQKRPQGTDALTDDGPRTLLSLVHEALRASPPQQSHASCWSTPCSPLHHTDRCWLPCRPCTCMSSHRLCNTDRFRSGSQRAWNPRSSTRRSRPGVRLFGFATVPFSKLPKKGPMQHRRVHAALVHVGPTST